MIEIPIERRGSIAISVWPEEPTLEGVRVYFESAFALLKQGQPIAFVLDATRVKRVSGGVRELAVRALKESATERRRYLQGEAVVLHSALVRGVLAAMYLVSPPGYPAKTFATVDDAKKWAEHQVAARAGAARISA